MTGLRIVAAAWVVLFHLHFTPLSGVEQLTAALGPLVTQGALGVDLFFVLSGFVIARTHLDRLGPRPRLRTTASFVWARAARMWPAYLVVLHLFGAWLLYRSIALPGATLAYQAVQPRLTAGEWLQQLVGVQLWDEARIDGASWVGPTWSISAEWLVYLLFPLLAPVAFRLRRLPVVVLALGSLLCLVPTASAFAVAGTAYYPYSWLVRVLGGFAAGVLAMLVVRRLRDDDRTRARASVLATVVAVAIPAGLLAGAAAGHGWHGGVVLLFPVLIAALALADRGPLPRLLATRPMVHGGRISYALYLVHIPLFEVLWHLCDVGVVPDDGTGDLVAAGFLLATLPVAHLLYALVETPARRRLRGRSRVAAAHVEPAASGTQQVGAEHAGTQRSGLQRIGTVSTGSVRVDTPAARRDPETVVMPAVPAAELLFTPGAGVPRVAPAPAPVTSARNRVPAAAQAPAPVAPAPVVPRGTLATADGNEGAPRGTATTGTGAFGTPVAGTAAAGTAAAGTAATGDVATGTAAGVVGRGDTDQADRGGRPYATRPATRSVVPEARPARAGGGAGSVRMPGTRSGAEHCGRSRRGAHSAGTASAATPVVAAAGAAAARRRRRPSHAV
ncbi:acyltransferase family protein [Pseudonocardia phyllosphaerae]|uniref:acyltransferase family protein n=1 Tax=Pseudonocardia phyllosphaerae TaxID=3390502 RepID=UPI00397AB74A